MKAQQVADYYIVHECTRVSNQASSDSDRCEPSCDNFKCKVWVGGSKIGRCKPAATLLLLLWVSLTNIVMPRGCGEAM